MADHQLTQDGDRGIEQSATKVNKREASVDTTWSFVRTASTIAGIPTRIMEIQIDGHRGRKAEANQKDGRQSTARKADGIGLYQDQQIYVAEAAQ
ncbi:hypothetical protein DFQ27_000379, partial [Actinomortierella ambigua]